MRETLGPWRRRWPRFTRGRSLMALFLLTNSGLGNDNAREEGVCRSTVLSTFS